MKSKVGMNERRKVADLTKALGTVSPNKNAMIFKISVHYENILNFLFNRKTQKIN
tara:strand:- start:6815 stop:6979 length:165 start_codon:yes stop_codon:yes gene_type:complete